MRNERVGTRYEKGAFQQNNMLPTDSLMNMNCSWHFEGEKKPNREIGLFQSEGSLWHHLEVVLLFKNPKILESLINMAER